MARRARSVPAGAARARRRGEDAVLLTVRIERKAPGLPAFATVPASAVAAWGLVATTTVEAQLEETELGRRSLLRGDAGQWFVEFHAEHLLATRKVVGDRARLALLRASTALPVELKEVLAAHPAARTAWRRLTAAQKRVLREDVIAAAAPATRLRRAKRALLAPPAAAAPRAARRGPAPAAARTVRVRILGRALPGRQCGPYAEVAVALLEGAGCAAPELVPGDARTARFEADVEVVPGDGAPAFRGAAVRGPPRERFLYLTWIGRLGGAPPAMFRRAKLRLDAVPAAALADALRSGRLVGRLALTAPDGMPVCGSVRPPAIAWSGR